MHHDDMLLQYEEIKRKLYETYMITFQLLKEENSRLKGAIKASQEKIKYLGSIPKIKLHIIPNCLSNSYNVLRYIGRYLGRPVISTRRIDAYDGDFVTFHYNRHEDEQLVSETLPVLDFMERLIRHIPEKHFKMIRYYGIYARHRESDKKIHRAISKEKQKLFLSFNRWRELILLSYVW